jgi:uncharacterized Tic20 family protein
MTNDSNSIPPVGTNYGQPAQPLSPNDEKLWATLIHIGGLFFGFWPALVGYLVLKDRGPFVKAHTKTALNFQISIAIYSLALGLFSLITFGFGTFLYIPFVIVLVIFSIMAAIAANKGELYTYPLTIAFIK